jgi:hypothetical protein
MSQTLRLHITAVSLELATSNRGTILTVTQEIVERHPGEASFKDSWGLSLENLRRLFLNGSGPLFCDYSLTHREQVAVEAQISRPAKEVFTGLIDPQQLERYMADKATVEPRPGGIYDFGWGGNGPIKILELEPDRKLTYSWRDQVPLSAGPWKTRRAAPVLPWSIPGLRKIVPRMTTPPAGGSSSTT